MGHKFGTTLLLIGVIEFALSYGNSKSSTPSHYDSHVPCNTPKGSIGECVILEKCPSLSRYEENSQCGMDGSIPKFCCPFGQQPDVRFSKQHSYDWQQGLHSGERRPNSEQRSASFGHRGHNFKRLRGNFGLVFEGFEQERSDDRQQQGDNFGRGHGDYKKQGNNFGSNGDKSRQKDGKLEQYGTHNEWKNHSVTQPDSNLHLLPTNCGQDVSNKIFGGQATGFDDFPWMALLEYRTHKNFIEIPCGGALISKRYVLTAAHCLKSGIIASNWKLESVRLGEYNTATTYDCIFNEDGSQSCIKDPPLRVGVEEIILHEWFTSSGIDKRYDIALLRLSQDVVFTKYIKPICLPTAQNINSMVTVVGWGATEYRKVSNVKLKVTLPYFNTQQCSKVYHGWGRTVGQSQFCAGGQKGFDSCNGDSGGPVMQLNMRADRTVRWEIVGVVSYGHNACGTEGIPGVYTKVFNYGQWIIERLRA